MLKQLYLYFRYDRGCCGNCANVFGWNPLLWLLPCNLCRGGGDGLRYEVNVSYDLQRRCWMDGASSRQTVRRMGRMGRDKERVCSTWKERKERDRQRDRDRERLQKKDRARKRDRQREYARGGCISNI